MSEVLTKFEMLEKNLDYPECVKKCPDIIKLKAEIEELNIIISSKINQIANLEHVEKKLRQNIADLLKYKRAFGTRKSKFNNKITKVNGISFDSKKEAKRYGELLFLQKAGEVKTIEHHKNFKVVQNAGGKAINYEVDFIVTWKDGKVSHEDVKGVRTPLYKLKKELMKKNYNIDIVEL